MFVRVPRTVVPLKYLQREQLGAKSIIALHGITFVIIIIICIPDCNLQKQLTQPPKKVFHWCIAQYDDTIVLYIIK
jgi:hypothetical protein